jgi:caa(3)-type oxidase subunit IV
MAHSHAHAHDAHHEPHPDSYYIKIWAILLVLLIVSVLGPMLENPVITLLTAFGIALVKAGIVCAYFMHLNIEKKYIIWLLLISIFLMSVFFAGVAPDVLKAQGVNWKWEKMNIVPVSIKHHGEGTNATHH